MSEGTPPGWDQPEPTRPIHLPQPMNQGPPPGGSGHYPMPYAGAPAPVPGGGGYAQVVVARPRVGGAHLAIAWVAAVLTFAYFLPWAIAASRQKSNTLAIGLVNFLLGWTFIGWVAALVMACMTEAPAVTAIAYAGPPVAPVGPPAGWYPDGSGMRQYWDGTRWTGHTAP